MVCCMYPVQADMSIQRYIKRRYMQLRPARSPQLEVSQPVFLGNGAAPGEQGRGLFWQPGDRHDSPRLGIDCCRPWCN